MISKAASFDVLFDGKCEWKKIFVYQYQILRRSVDNRVGIMGKPGNVRLTGTIVIPADQLEDLVPLLEEHIVLTRKEPGCLHFDVTQDAETPELFHVSELFTCEDAFATHQKNGAARRWGPASANLSRDFHKETL